MRLKVPRSFLRDLEGGTADVSFGLGDLDLAEGQERRLETNISELSRPEFEPGASRSYSPRGRSCYANSS